MMNEDEMSRACRKFWEKMNAYKALVGKAKGKTKLRVSRRRWQENINMNIIEK
jgi:hypothetical protein